MEKTSNFYQIEKSATPRLGVYKFRTNKKGEMNAQNIISIASRSDFEKILAFLDRQGLAENAWLIGSVFDALQRDEVWETVYVCFRRRHQVVGVAYVLYQRKVPVGDRAPGYDGPGHDYDVQMDAEDSGAVEAMIAAFPSDQLGSFCLYRPLMQAYFEALPGVVRMAPDPYFTVSPERFCSVAGEEVVELTAADAGLYEGCEYQPNWEYMWEESRVFGIVRNGRVVTSLSSTPLTPAVGSKRRRVRYIGGLYTETPYRRQGLGKRLLSYVTELILRDGHVPLYCGHGRTETDTAASQALAQGLGYWQIMQRMTYLWRKV